MKIENFVVYLSWIIPAYNEERRIAKTLKEVEEYLRSKNFSGGYEIIVVDSSSKDKTEDVVKNIQKENPRLHLLKVANKGKGWAVKEGMLRATGDIRLFSDADNSTTPDYFNNMESSFKQEYDIVISSRHPRDVEGATRDIKEPWYREILGGLGNMVIQIFGVWGIWDTQNGFKAFTANAAKEIFSKTIMTGFSFDIEVLALSRRLHHKIAIIPVRWKFDADSKVTMSAYIKVFIDVFKIRWNLITNKYKI